MDNGTAIVLVLIALVIRIRIIIDGYKRKSLWYPFLREFLLAPISLSLNPASVERMDVFIILGTFAMGVLYNYALYGICAVAGIVVKRRKSPAASKLKI